MLHTSTLESGCKLSSCSVKRCRDRCKFTFTIISSTTCLHTFLHATPTSFFTFLMFYFPTTLRTELFNLLIFDLHRSAAKEKRKSTWPIFSFRGHSTQKSCPLIIAPQTNPYLMRYIGSGYLTQSSPSAKSQYSIT